MKTYMKNRREAIRADIKLYLKINEELQADELEQQLVHYRATTVPVQFSNGVVINGTLLKGYVRRISKRSVVEAALCDGSIEIRHRSSTTKGKFTFNDTSEYYPGLIIPKGEDLLEELRISKVGTI